MIHFNELRITPDSKHLIIEAEIDSDSYYNQVYIDKIEIDTQETFVVNGPSNNPLYTYSTEEKQKDLIYSLPENCNCNPVQIEDDYSYCFVDGIDNLKRVRLVLSAKDLGVDLSKNMFFIYVIAKGIPTADIPCALDKSIEVNTVVDLAPFYKASMSYIRELNNRCETPRGFIDMILRFKALQLSIKTGNYMEAIRLWKEFFVDEYSTMLINNCNCNGRIN